MATRTRSRSEIVKMILILANAHTGRLASLASAQNLFDLPGRRQLDAMPIPAGVAPVRLRRGLHVAASRAQAKRFAGQRRVICVRHPAHVAQTHVL